MEPVTVGILLVLAASILGGYLYLESRDRREALDLQSAVWELIFQIRCLREREARHVPTKWMKEYDAFFREQQKAPHLSIEEEGVDWRKCRRELTATRKRLLEFASRLNAEIAEVQRVRRENPVQLRRLGELLAELKTRNTPRSTPALITAQDSHDSMLAIHKITSSSVAGADDVLTMAKIIDRGLDACRELLGPSDLP
jgi:hypothetical protein